MAGYSRTPLITKLGIKGGEKIVIINAPDNYADLLGVLPENVSIKTKLGFQERFIHFFTTDAKTAQSQFPKLKHALASNGILWISWPKKSSGIQTDINENTVREIGLRNDLVDVKIAAIDEIWSGLKFVYRLKDR